MQEIDRIEAEEFFSMREVITQNLYQIKEALWVYFIFSNGNLLVVKYDHISKQKSYFAEGFEPVQNRKGYRRKSSNEACYFEIAVQAERD